MRLSCCNLVRVSRVWADSACTSFPARQVPLTLGSDTNGSIRVPSSFCGVWGLKPTFGRLSRRGSYPFVNSIDHLGPFADDLDGLALAYDALQGPDPLDPGCFATRVQPVTRSLGQVLTPEGEESQVLRWTDPGGAWVEARFAAGRLASWALQLPPEVAEAVPDPASDAP